jgi:hypothetical protein
MASVILSIVQELLRETRKIIAVSIFAGCSILPLVATQPRQQVAWATRPILPILAIVHLIGRIFQ